MPTGRRHGATRRHECSPSASQCGYAPLESTWNPTPPARFAQRARSVRRRRRPHSSTSLRACGASGPTRRSSRRASRLLYAAVASTRLATARWGTPVRCARCAMLGFASPRRASVTHAPECELHSISPTRYLSSSTSSSASSLRASSSTAVGGGEERTASAQRSARRSRKSEERIGAPTVSRPRCWRSASLSGALTKIKILTAHPQVLQGLARRCACGHRFKYSVLRRPKPKAKQSLVFLPARSLSSRAGARGRAPPVARTPWRRGTFHILYNHRSCGFTEKGVFPALQSISSHQCQTVGSEFLSVCTL